MKKKIAIIGGGIAGLTFSLCLQNEEYECSIFEKKKAFGEIGAAISVFPNALCVIDLHVVELQRFRQNHGCVLKLAKLAATRTSLFNILTR